MSTPATAARSVALPTARVLIGTVYGVCVVGFIAVLIGEALVSDADPYRPEGPVGAMIGVGLGGTAALLIGVGLGLWLVRTPERSKVGAILFAALSVLALIVVWSGAPGVFGACAAWLAGLTRGGRPLGGAARIAGVVGVFMALLNMVLTVGGVLVSVFTDLN